MSSPVRLLSISVLLSIFCFQEEMETLRLCDWFSEQTCDCNECTLTTGLSAHREKWELKAKK